MLTSICTWPSPSTASFYGMICLFFAITAGSVMPSQVWAQSPGGVSSNLDFWLKANANVYNDAGTTAATNGQAVQQWNTQTGTNHFTQATAGERPTFRTNRINGYPILEFTGNTHISAGVNVGVTSTGSFNMFLVIKQNSYVLGGMTDGSGSFIVDRVVEDNNLMSFKMVTNSRYGYQKRSDTGGNLGGPVSSATVPTGVYQMIDYYRVYGSQFGLYIDGRLDATDNTGASDAILGTRVKLGRHAVGANQGMNGEIAEVILYRGAVSAADRNKVDSYLALKYGLTLDPASSPLQDYVNSAGTVVYPSSSVAGFQPYRYDVAGVIDDNTGSGLRQITSKSQNTNAIVSMTVAGAGSSLNAGEWLIWGSNNGSLTTGNTSDIGGTVQRRLARVWRVRESTGDVGNMNVSFDLGAIPGSKTASDLVLLIDRDGDGFADNDVTPIGGGSITSGVVTFNGVNFNNNDFFTLGTINKTNTPLPVELVSFNAAYVDPVVNLSWATASERNNSHFLVERSLDGIDFFTIGRIEGHGTTTTRQEYAFSDEVPVEGRTYYRLMQVDYDEQFDYSPVKSVYIAPVEALLTVSPNPVTEGKVIIRSRKRDLNISSIALIDAQGRVLDRTQPQSSRQSTATYQLPDLRQGIYFLRIVANGRGETHRIVVN